MRKGFMMIGMGIAVWGAAALFFRLLGDWVLVEPGDAHFGSSLFLLILLTLLVIIGLALVVRLKWLPERGSATRFGYTAAAIGLLLDSVTLWRREAVFPAFSEGQHHTFAIWMTLGYALMLLVPAAIDRIVRDRAVAPGLGQEPDDGKPQETAPVTDAASQADTHSPEKELL